MLQAMACFQFPGLCTKVHATAIESGIWPCDIELENPNAQRAGGTFLLGSQWAKVRLPEGQFSSSL